MKNIWKKPKIKHNKLTKWNWMVSYPKGLILGKNTDIGAFTYIQAKEGIIIENNVQIGAHSRLYSVNTINKTKGKIYLKEGCMIGANTTILPNVIVEKGVLIKAHSILKEGVYTYNKNNNGLNKISTLMNLPKQELLKGLNYTFLLKKKD